MTQDIDPGRTRQPSEASPGLSRRTAPTCSPRAARGPSPARSGDPHAAQTGPFRHASVTSWRESLSGSREAVRSPLAMRCWGDRTDRAAEYATATGDLFWPSRRAVDGPHADLLRRARQAGELSDEEILDSPYGRMAARCIDVFGQYFQPLDAAGIVEIARDFIDRTLWCSRSYDQTRTSVASRNTDPRRAGQLRPLPGCRRSSPDREPGDPGPRRWFPRACAGHEYERRCRTCSTRCRGSAATRAVPANRRARAPARLGDGTALYRSSRKGWTNSRQVWYRARHVVLP